MFKVDKKILHEEQCVVFELCGRMRVEETVELRKLIRAEKQKVVLDLKDVRLVDRAAVRFLAQCQVEGIEIRNPSAYIQEWIAKEVSARNMNSSPAESGNS